MESMGKAWKAWGKHGKHGESMGKHEKHGKHGKSMESMGFMQMNLHPFGSLAFLASTSTLVTWLAHSPREASHPNAA